MKNLTVNNSTKMVKQFIGVAEAEITIILTKGDLTDGVIIAEYNDTTSEYIVKDKSVIGVNAVITAPAVDEVLSSVEEVAPSVEEVAPAVDEVLTTKLVIKKSTNIVVGNKTNYVMQIVVSSNIANVKKVITDAYDIVRILDTDKFLVSRQGQDKPFIYDVTFEDARKQIMKAHNLVYVSKVPRRLATLDGLKVAMLSHTSEFLNSMGFNVENITLEQATKLRSEFMGMATEILGEPTLGVLEIK